MNDVMERVGGALIQHGPAGNRVYVVKLHGTDPTDVLSRAEALATREGYGKIIAKCPTPALPALTADGFEVEAEVPQLFGPNLGGAFVVKFLEPARRVDSRMGRIEEVLRAAAARSTDPASPPVESPAVIDATRSDAPEIAACYADVFESYPFPIHDPAYIRAAMDQGTRFFSVRDGGRVVAASSMEGGGAPGAVEMTDFATRMEYRDRGLARRLLARMDHCAAVAGVRVAFTIARGLSFGMNITFSRRGYRYAGTLINNTQIAGSIESMNVWYRHPDRSQDIPSAQPQP